MREASLLVVSTLLVVALAGCFGGADDGDDGDDGGGDGMDPGAVAFDLDVAWTDVVDSVNASQAFMLNWSVERSDGNDSMVEIPHTAVHYANFSVAESDLSTPDDYGNASGVMQPADIPGQFSASLTFDDVGTMYVRAHAIHNGTHYWSDEIVVEVMAGATGTTHTITIGGVGNGAGATSEYNPDPHTISVGDAVVWQNDDAIAPHTATSDDGAPAAFDTGSIATGTSSEAIVFTTPGTYTYHCDVHPGSMNGVTLIVQ